MTGPSKSISNACRAVALSLERLVVGYGLLLPYPMERRIRPTTLTSAAGGRMYSVQYVYSFLWGFISSSEQKEHALHYINLNSRGIQVIRSGHCL